MACIPGLSIYAQDKRKGIIVLDSFYTEESGKPTGPNAISYFKVDKKIPNGGPSDAFAFPIIIDHTKFFIYNRYLKSQKAVVVDSLDILNYVDSLSLLHYYDPSENLLQLSNVFTLDFVSSLTNTALYSSNPVVGFDSNKTPGPKNLIVKKSIILTNSIFDFDVQYAKLFPSLTSTNDVFDSVIFVKKFSAYRNWYRSLVFDKAIFLDTCEIGFGENVKYFTQKSITDQSDNTRKIVFKNSVFKAPLFLIQEPKMNNSWALSHIGFENVSFGDQFLVQANYLNAISFKDCNFKGPLFLSYKKIDSTKFDRCTFNNSVDLRNLQLTDGPLLQNAFFSKNCNVLISPLDEIEKYGFDAIAMEKIFFIIDWGWKSGQLSYVNWDKNSKTFFTSKVVTLDETFDSIINPLSAFSEHDLEQVKLKLQKIKDYVDKTVTGDDLFSSNKERIKNWLDYQEKQYEKFYFKKQNKLKYFWLSFIENTVNFGYNGELKFFKFCFWIILFFSILYRLLYRKEISAYLTKSRVPANNYFTDEIPRPWKKYWFYNTITFFNIDFIKSFFVSFLVFFNPKISSTIFQYEKKFIWIILLEWIVGLLFVILFLFYIAGHYPVVTKLIGL